MPAEHPSVPAVDFAPAPIATPAVPKRRTLVFAACLMATFMAAVESTIVATAMPTIVAQLGGFSLFSWVFAVYLLTQAVSIPVYGRLADIHGRKPVFYAGAGLFLVGSVLSGFAPNMIMLIVFRAIQGLGAGGVQPIAATICGDIYSPSERAKVQGIISSLFGVAAVLGPSLGAWLVEHGAWQLVFWVNVPVGIAAIAMISMFLTENVERRTHRIDYLGSLLLLVAVGALMLVLVQGERLGLAPAAAVGGVGVAALVALLTHERRTPEPMLALELLRDRVILVGGFGGALAGAVMMGVAAFLPAYVQGAMEESATNAGLVLGAMSITWAVTSIAGGRLMLRTSYRLVAVIGACCLVAGCVLLVLLTPTRGVGWATAGSLVVGAGMGFCNTAFIVSSQAAVAWNQRGAATSWCLFLRFIGQAVGAAACGAVLNASLLRAAPDSGHLLDRLLEPDLRAALPAADRAHLIGVISAGLHDTYLLVAVFAVFALVLVTFLPARLGPAQQTLR